jgi:hypothetical protein
VNNNVRHPGGPLGGLQLPARAMRRWRWSPKGELRSAPVRCKREQWYLARAFPADGVADESAEVLLRFLRAEQPIREQRVGLSAVAEAANGEALLGWVQAPEGATHLQVCLPDACAADRFDKLVLHPVAERDPKCHPLANVPRWSTYRPPFPIDRVVLPATLKVLADRLTDLKVELIAEPRSLRKLAAKVVGAACVIDPAWVRRLGLTLRDLERVAAASWMIVDLQTLALLLERAGTAATQVVTHTSEQEIMSARVEHAGVPTRGFAMQDVLPYATLAGVASFRTRVLRANRAWKRYAHETGFATLLSSETPWEDKCGDVLSAARPVEHGELIATDLPWLVAGQHGRLLAPRLAEHLLRMHVAASVADGVQYWNRWDDTQVLVRDIVDLASRFPPLRAVRWAPTPSGLARLGITLPAQSVSAKPRSLMICTGRIDQCAVHDGVPPESMVIFMKWLVREAREGTRWAGRFLRDTAVTWQFDAADGLKYVVEYESALGVVPETVGKTLVLRAERGDARGAAAGRVEAGRQVVNLPADAGVFGDRSLEYQRELTQIVRQWVERAAR